MGCLEFFCSHPPWTKLMEVTIKRQQVASWLWAPFWGASKLRQHRCANLVACVWSETSWKESGQWRAYEGLGLDKWEMPGWETNKQTNSRGNSWTWRWSQRSRSKSCLRLWTSFGLPANLIWEIFHHLWNNKNSVAHVLTPGLSPSLMVTGRQVALWTPAEETWFCNQPVRLSFPCMGRTWGHLRMTCRARKARLLGLTFGVPNSVCQVWGSSQEFLTSS